MCGAHVMLKRLIVPVPLTPANGCWSPLIMHVFHVCWPGQLKLATLLNITEGSCSCLPLPVMMMVMAIY